MRLLWISLVFFLLAGCREKSVPPALISEIDSVSHKWVPDTREGICNIAAEVIADGRILISGETDNPEVRNEIIAFSRESGINVMDSIMIVPDTSAIRKRWGIVSVSVCNIKAKPSFASEMVSQAIMGTPVKILKLSGSWMLVQTPDFYIGWITGGSLKEMDDSEFSRWKSSARIIYLPKSGDILSSVNPDDIVSDIVAGSVLELKGRQKDRNYVILPDGREGKLPVATCRDFKAWSSETVPEAGKMIAFGKSVMGAPYMWGGTSTKAFDCSGFTKTLFFMGGVILARDASLQFLSGKPLEVTDDFGNLQPGDLIFFGHRDNRGIKRITHVGMYIGDTEVIHCSGMVRINSLDPSRTDFSSYLKETLMGAGRFIGNPDQRGTRNVKSHPWYF